MMERAQAHAHCRISRVKPKNGGAIVEIIRMPEISSEIVSLMVEMLGIARQGRIGAYAIAFHLDDGDGNDSWHLAWALPSAERYNIDGRALLGNIEVLAARLRRHLIDE